MDKRYSYRSSNDLDIMWPGVKVPINRELESIIYI
jgi:hypothetical protein